jgi:hypothetical protein
MPNGKTLSDMGKKKASSTLKGQARHVKSVPAKPIEKGQRKLQISIAKMNTQNCNQKNDESPDPYYIMSPNQHW